MSTMEDPSPRVAVRGRTSTWRDGVLAEAALPASPQSARAARTVVDDALRRIGEVERTDVAVLLTSELVTNAVLHARSDVLLRVLRETAGVRVEVVDRSTAVPVPRDFSEEAATGRGLLLVDAMADDWGAAVDGDAKTVWFRLAGGPR